MGNAQIHYGDTQVDSTELTYEQRVKDAEKMYDPKNMAYANILGGESSTPSVTYDRLRNLAGSPQNNLDNTLTIIGLARQYVNMDDIIGLTFESIENNINTKVRLSYKGIEPARRAEVKQVIEDFNEQINLSNLIVQSVSSTWRDGTYIACLRESGGSYVVDYYPLGVALVSDYCKGDQPCVLIDMQELKSRLQKNYTKKKNRKPLFFANMDEEVKQTYPKEVYDAYRQNEQYAQLPVEYSCVMRVNHQNMKYGLTPIFRALPPTLTLEDFGKADRSVANARAKKIIHQRLHKEILGEDYNRSGFPEMAYAHQTLLDAWRQPTVVVTTPPTVESIEYVEPKAETTNINLVQYYRTKAMNTLGISFLASDSTSSMSVANISIKQLMRTINKISRQLEVVLKKWYRVVLATVGLDPAWAPTVKIIDAEMMEADVRNALVDTLFTKLGCSYETAFELLGVSVEDERIRRTQENADELETVFSPRQTAYTTTGQTNGNTGGRPKSNDEGKADKQAYDEERHKAT
ncbi:MAG: hypothetical protein J6S14_20825 [Clostridia bacterium]|nr:hypothetical protein [Clostridia bacterium]